MRARMCVHSCLSSVCVSLFGAVLKSRPRLIDLHYLIVQRLPPAARAYASAFCFTLGLSMEFACADDKFQVTTALRRWLECDSSIPRTWGALLVALRRDFHFKEIPPTWVDDISEDLVRKYTHADVCMCHDKVQEPACCVYVWPVSCGHAPATASLYPVLCMQMEE